MGQTAAERSRKSYLRHAEKRRAARIAYRQLHLEEERARDRAWHAANSDHDNAVRRVRYAKNPEPILSYNREYRENHVEPLKEARLAKHAADPTRRRTSAQIAKCTRRALKANAPINDFSSAQWHEMLVVFHSCCAYCGRHMQQLTQDHITPLEKGGSHTLWNIVPACRVCNSKKHTGPPLCPVQPLLFTLAKPKKDTGTLARARALAA